MFLLVLVLVVVFFELIVHEVLVLLLIPQVSRRANTHFVEGELTWRVVHYAHLFTFVVTLVVYHVYFVAPNIILTAESLSLVHLIPVL